MPGRPCAHEVLLPGCKSLSARHLLLAACARGRSRLRGVSDSDDTRHLAGALRALGARVEAGPGGVWTVDGWGGAPRARGVRADVGAAGASLRFLLALLAAGETDVLLTGHPRLRERPHGPLLEVLGRLGARIEEHRDPERPGFRVRGRGLPGGDWEAPVRASSQYLSALLLAAGLAAGPVRLRVPGVPPSAGYVDLTLAALEAWREPGAVRRLPGGFALRPGLPRAGERTVPGDPSGATFFLVAAVLAGRPVAPGPAWAPGHPEAGLHRQLLAAGVLAAGDGTFRPTGRVPAAPLDLDLDPAPDAGPACTVLGCWLPAGMRLRRVGRLRLKESDRVAGCRRLAAALGSPAHLDGDDLVLAGGGFRPPAGGGKLAFDPDGDHRLAMAAGVAALRAPWLTVLDPGCVGKSFPGFWRQLAAWREAA